MRIISEKKIKDYADVPPDAKTALQTWVKNVRAANWKNAADVRNFDRTVDSIGDQRYVFNIKGNHHRLVVVIKFTVEFVLVRFIGTHAEYDKIDCKTI